MNSIDGNFVLEDVLNTLFQVVAVYSCEQLKAQKKYCDVYLWFKRRNDIVEVELRKFIEKNKLKMENYGNTCEYKGEGGEEDINEVISKLSQYYWDLYQYHDVTYIDEYLKSTNISKEDLMELLRPLAKQFRKKLRSDFIDATEFSEKYVFSTFLVKDKLIKTLFKYFQIIYELKYDEIRLSTTSLQIKFLELINIIPYYSIFSKSSIAAQNKYLTEMREKRYATLHTPFNFLEGALVDNIIHFIFQHLCDLLTFDEVKGEKNNFDIWRYHKASLRAALEVTSKTSSSMGSKSDFLIDRDEHYSRLNECVNIIKNLLQSLPAGQSQIFESCQNTASMEALLISIIYAFFIDQYDREHLDENLKSNASELYGKSIEQNSKKLKAFFYYLGKEFEDIGFEPEVKIDSNADKCSLTLKSGGKILINLSNKNMDGNNIRSRFKNHKIFFNY